MLIGFARVGRGRFHKEKLDERSESLREQFESFSGQDIHRVQTEPYDLISNSSVFD